MILKKKYVVVEQFGDIIYNVFFGKYYTFATIFGALFDTIFCDIQIGVLYPSVTLFTNDIYVCWKEKE